MIFKFIRLTDYCLDLIIGADSKNAIFCGINSINVQFNLNLRCFNIFELSIYVADDFA